MLMKRLFIFTIALVAILIALIIGVMVCAEKYAPNYFNNGPSISDSNKNGSDVSDAPKIKKPVARTDINIILNAKSYMILDRETLTPLLSYNPEEALPLASITKLMTAIVTLENAKIEDIVEIKNDFTQIPSYKLGLYLGETISIESLLYASLIPSANDAAQALAYHIGGGDYDVFLKMMNAKAEEIGMKDTHYTNAIGLDTQSNYSTVLDLAYLANYAINNDFIAEAVVLEEKTITDASGTIYYTLKSTNELLGDPEIQVLGLKTGKTPGAGECLVSIEKLKNGQEILTVILGSYDRFGDTRKLIQWIEENVDWE